MIEMFVQLVINNMIEMFVQLVISNIDCLANICVRYISQVNYTLNTNCKEIRHLSERERKASCRKEIAPENISVWHCLALCVYPLMEAEDYRKVC
jgi:hypothetical protein